MRWSGDTFVNWLITIKVDVDLEQILRKLILYGCEIAGDLTPMPLGESEQVLEIIGPKDLPEKIAGDDSVLEIYPNSELTLFDDN